MTFSLRPKTRFPPLTANNQPTPAQVYLDIAHKVENGHEFSQAEAKIDFTRLFHALRASISQNNILQARVDSAETLITELNIDNTIKDLEIFNFTTQTEEKDNKTHG